MKNWTDPDVELQRMRTLVAEKRLDPIHLADAKVGFTKLASLEELQKLSVDFVMRLAGMAITFYDSPWSDKDRDLMLGIRDVLKRDPAE
ncbi:MAG: hypothetical protein MN733_20580 [Nitrososphaera sp.]|nr:hypothetical protein [Nitrososphaera sp.]